MLTRYRNPEISAANSTVQPKPLSLVFELRNQMHKTITKIYVAQSTHIPATRKPKAAVFQKALVESRQYLRHKSALSISINRGGSKLTIFPYRSSIGRHTNTAALKVAALTPTQLRTSSHKRMTLAREQPMGSMRATHS